MMKSKKILLIDMDVCLNDFGKHWMRYLKSHYSLKHEYRFTLPYPLPYDLTKLFITTEESTGYEYFNYHTLYDNMPAREDALEYLPILCKEFEVVVASHTYGGHMTSKINWLNKYFPQIESIYCTVKNKSHIKCDIFVDDSIKNLNQMYSRYPDTKIIKFRTDYQEDVEPLCNYPVAYNWEMVYERLCG